MGLGTAFVLAGSRQVLASTRVVDDTQTSALMRHVYQDVDVSKDLAVGLWRALTEMLRRGEPVDARAWRVLEP